MSYYDSTTFQFDIREEDGLELLSSWIEEHKDESSAAKTISIIHWTFFYSSSDYCWSFVPDATVFTLTSSGLIKSTRTSGQLDTDACKCEMAAILEAQCKDWTMNGRWTLTDFVAALRQEDSLLIQAVTKFVDLVQKHDEVFHIWGGGPRSCSGCGKQMIFLRAFENVEWSSD